MSNNSHFSVDDLVIYFKSIEGYFTGEKKMFDFIKSMIGNQSIDTVISKVAAIGNPSLWQNGGQTAMAAHIHSLNIDDRLMKGDLSVVTDICKFEMINNPCELYHFASKYCCYHFPNLFPIYCSSSHRLVNAFNSGQCKDIKDHYEWYVEKMKSIKEEFSLTPLNYLELNKFLWLYEEQLSEIASAKRLSIPCL